jgi:hypothetical protein
MKFKNWFCSDSKLIYAQKKIEKMNTLISTFHFWLHNYTARLSNVLNVKGDSVVCPEWRQQWGTNRLTNIILQGLMMISIHGPDDSEFDFRTAMNIWGKLRKRHILGWKSKGINRKIKTFEKKLWWNLFC